MKAGLAVAIAAAGALARSGEALRGRLLVQSVVGEEDGGLGTFAAIERGQRADAAIVLEPTRLRLIPAQAGALSFRLHVPGRAAHAAVRYRGVSALEKFELLHAALHHVEAELNRERHPLFARYEIPYPLSIGRLRAGEWSATVPDTLECEGRVGVPVGMPVEAVRARVERALADAAAADVWLREHPPRLEWVGGQFEPAEADVEGEPFRWLRAAHERELGAPVELDGAPYGSDMRLFVNRAGMPAVLYGPGDIDLAHQVDESIDLEEVRVAARVVTAAAAEYLA